jgi:hypothetical protein
MAKQHVPSKPTRIKTKSKPPIPDNRPPCAIAFRDNVPVGEEPVVRLTAWAQINQAFLAGPLRAFNLA